MRVLKKIAIQAGSIVCGKNVHFCILNIADIPHDLCIGRKHSSVKAHMDLIWSHSFYYSMRKLYLLMEVQVGQIKSGLTNIFGFTYTKPMSK